MKDALGRLFFIYARNTHPAAARIAAASFCKKLATNSEVADMEEWNIPLRDYLSNFL